MICHSWRAKKMILKIAFVLTAWVIAASTVIGTGEDVGQKNEKELTSVQEGNCFCGVFKDNDDPEETVPIIEKKIPDSTKFSCDENGKTACLKRCVSMVQSAKSKAPVVLCNSINEKQVDGLMVKVYSRLYGGKWNYTGKTSRSPLCCRNGQPVKCVQEKEKVPLADLPATA